MPSCSRCGTVERFRLKWFTCPDCQTHHLCPRCVDNPVTTSTGTGEERTWVVRSVCRPCLERASTLDFSRSVDVVGAAAGEAPSIVFVHGGGSCRLMFACHARELAARGFRCVLLDLPAHGALLDTSLTIESACERIAAVTREHAPPHRGFRPVYVGGSLGGFLGMELLGREPELFSCAVIGQASQTVGIGAGCMARFALVAMKAALGGMYGETIVKQMLKAVTSSRQLMHDAIDECVAGPSMFFQRGMEQVAVLQQTQPVAALQNYRGPVLFADGSKDHHDNRDRLLAVAQANNPRSRVVVYEGGDHFFSHDRRFFAQFIDEIENFTRETLGACAAGATAAGP
jgi:pimeloyl-ACP methyl ester carboxylesterase